MNDMRAWCPARGVSTFVAVGRPCIGMAATTLALALLAGCDSSEYVAGIDGSGARIFAQGPIEAFGSIVLDGVHYDVARADIRVNGAAASESDLELGQIVMVEGTRDGGGRSIAGSVAYEAKVRGPITAIDVAGMSLGVLGQNIETGTDTVFDLGAGAGMASLAVGDGIEVSGFAAAGGVLHATYIGSAASTGNLRVIGRVADLDSGTLEFTIGALVVDYSAAGIIEGFPGGGPAEGDEVLVEGAALDATGALSAARLELIGSESSDREGTTAEVEGLITRFVSPAEFDVDGAPAATTATTVYEGGDAGDLQLNVKIQIEGRFDSAGRIVASKVEIKDGGRVY